MESIRNIFQKKRNDYINRTADKLKEVCKYKNLVIFKT